MFHSKEYICEFCLVPFHLISVPPCNSFLVQFVAIWKTRYWFSMKSFAPCLPKIVSDLFVSFENCELRAHGLLLEWYVSDTNKMGNIYNFIEMQKLINLYTYMYLWANSVIYTIVFQLLFPKRYIYIYI